MVQKAPPLRVPRDRQLNMLLAQDEYNFYEGLARALNINVSTLVRNAASVALMSVPPHAALHTAREHAVTEAARVDKWRREQLNVAEPSEPPQPPAPPPPPQPMR